MKRSAEKDQASDLLPSAAWTELLIFKASAGDLRNTIKTSERTIAESIALLEKLATPVFCGLPGIIRLRFD
jgi:hypothetical protein